MGYVYLEIVYQSKSKLNIYNINIPIFIIYLINDDVIKSGDMSILMIEWSATVPTTFVMHTVRM